MLSTPYTPAPPRRRHRAIASSLAAIALTGSIVIAGDAHAAKNDGCEGGQYRLVAENGTTLAAGADVDTTLAASVFGGGTTFDVLGTYNEFTVRLSDFAIFDYAFTGAPNAEDITGGRRTPVFASKVPDHRGLQLAGRVTVAIDGPDLVIGRSGSGLSMKIQAKDCATGGIFQMEPERSDGTRTRIVHTLASTGDVTDPFFFDNPEFRARIGQFLGDDCTSITAGPPSRFCVQVNARVNIANDFSADFVARDSAQVATRVEQPDCNTADPLDPSIAHCGKVSVWDVASGGRMGFVTGEDAVEVANPPTNCVSNCQAQNQVRGRLEVLGFPFPVPAGSRLTPATSSVPLPPLTP